MHRDAFHAGARRRWAWALLGLFLLAMLAAACGQQTGPSASSGDDDALADIQGVEELRALFVQDSGRPRLLLLLSPT